MTESHLLSWSILQFQYHNFVQFAMLGIVMNGVVSLPAPASASYPLSYRSMPLYEIRTRKTKMKIPYRHELYKDGVLKLTRNTREAAPPKSMTEWVRQLNKEPKRQP